MSNLTAAYRQLENFAAGIIPSRFAAPDYEPTMSEAREVQNDLCMLARHVDGIIHQYGVHCREHGIIAADDLKQFTDVLANALDGNALYLISSGVEKRIEEVRETLYA